ncbi:LexA family protein [Spirosoma fluminis]
MLDERDKIKVGDVFKVVAKTKYNIPLFSHHVAAGFPSPAETHIQKVCDLNELCVYNKDDTYFFIVGSDSMIGDRIEPGDMLIVDNNYTAREIIDGRVVLVRLGTDFTVKRIEYVKDDLVKLVPSNPKYKPIYVREGEDAEVIGIVTHSLLKFF